MGDIVFDIIVQPLVYVLELSFSLLYELTGVEGAAIVGVSVVVNLLCLPLYRMADAAQARERDKQASMARWVKHIKKHFSGDERQMMLNTYYRQQGYHPLQALSGALPLLFQIPFFMAAYTYLSNLDLLQGATFWFIPDLGVPDGLLATPTGTYNVLPLAMTAFNVISTAIYTRGFPLRDKLQSYLLAVVFLVLLYDSPSGLVFYWTCNQVFSLGKNLFTSYVEHPGEKAIVLADVGIAAGAVWLLSAGKIQTVQDVWFMAMLLALVLGASALGLRALRGGQDVHEVHASQVAGLSGRALVAQFFLGSVLLTLLVGLVAPIAVIADSPTEFVNVRAFSDPLNSVWYAARVWGGLFVLWLGSYFLLADERGRRVLALAVWCACGVALVNYFFLAPAYGTLSTALLFDETVACSNAVFAASVILWLTLLVVLALVWRKVGSVVIPTLAIASVSLLWLIVPGVQTVQEGVQEALLIAQNDESSSELFNADGSVRPLLQLSKTGRNVVVFFADRALPGMVPFVMEEHPELEQQLDGFTYYPNTTSFGHFTNFGAPSLYGGYEYTPVEMNARPNESLVSKHNESLLVLPKLFAKQGFTSTIVDPAYVNYEWVPDLKLFDSVEQTKAYYLQDAYTDRVYEEYGIPYEGAVASKRPFFFYGLLRTVPEFLRGVVYDEGMYHDTSVSNPPDGVNMKNWSTLHLLPQLSYVTDSGNTYLNIHSEETHDVGLLRSPDYVPDRNVDEFDENGEKVKTLSDGRTMMVDEKEKLAHYHSNATLLLQLGQWFDWMREQGVYDNTRIIIVSDHGRGLNQFEGQSLDEDLDVEMVNALLMVKDFDTHGFTTSNEFMTIADTPTLATNGIVDDPVNPMTGEPISSSEKTAHEQFVTASSHWDVATNNGNVFDTSDRPWYAVHDNVFDLNDWRQVPDSEIQQMQDRLWQEHRENLRTQGAEPVPGRPNLVR